MSSDNRQGNGIRLDRTRGGFEIWQSPFTIVSEIALRLNITRGGNWRIEQNYIGGHGDVTQAVSASGEVVNLWRDARDKWYICKVMGRGWLPDLDATEALLSRSHDAPIESMGANHIKYGQA